MEILEKRLSKLGSTLGLSRIRKLLKKWGNPQNNFKVILVAGTNGKGSVVAYLSSILKEAGYRTGSFYSPHLIDYNERIKINGEKIPNKLLKKYSREIIKYLDSGGKITLFEAITAIAFRYFSEKRVEYAVMETGMGGRLDATNIANEEIGIITNIGLEHTRWLGKTEGKIAGEKAGIIKKGKVITGARGRALEVIKKTAKRKGKKIFTLGEDFL
ncbi:MAG: Mur ligase family protein [Candidatus Micrarchaeia archaeon]